MLQRSISTLRQCIALMLVLSLFVPMFAQAQADPVVPDVTAPLPDPVPTVSTVSDSAQTVSAPEATTTSAAEIVQDTAPAQDGVTAADLVPTANPEATGSATDTIPVVDASTTTAPIDLSIVPVVETLPVEQPVEIPIEAQQNLQVVATSLPQEATSTESYDIAEHVQEINANLDPDYVFAISGKTEPVTKKGAQGDMSVTNVAHTSINPTDGTITVSGACASAYYVVLIFKNNTDYINDPRSYVMNRAFPCVGGEYSYAIADVPVSLKNGTYYLMIGEQGERGPWSPITGLTEITINRSN